MAEVSAIWTNKLLASEKEIQLSASFIRRVIPHSGEIGSEIEKLFHRQLQRVLPERIGVSSGFVADSSGNISKQLDIILYDKPGAARLFEGDITVLPAECTFAAGEVKTNLAKAEIDDAFDKCRSFKSLDRSAQFQSKGPISHTYRLYGDENSQWPPIFFLLGINSPKKSTFHENCLTSLQRSGCDRRQKIDVVCSLDGRMKINCQTSTPVDFGGNVVPVAADSVALCASHEMSWATYQAEKPWALFASLLMSVMTQTPSTSVDMKKYLGEVTF